MEWSQWLVPVSGIALEFSVVGFFFRWRTWRSFAVYSIYIVFVLLQALSLTAVTFLYPHTYPLVYWLTAPVEILLAILATLESFWRVLKSFQLLRWFRFVLPAAILIALGYAALQGYRFPPVEATPGQAAIINATVAAHYLILAVAVLFFALVALLHVPWRVHEHRFMLGFGIAALAVAFGGSVRAVFGSHFEFVSRQAQPIGYLIALLIWFSAVVHPVPKDGVISPPVEIVAGLKSQWRNLRSFVRNSTR